VNQGSSTQHMRRHRQLHSSKGLDETAPQPSLVWFLNTIDSSSMENYYFTPTFLVIFQFYPSLIVSVKQNNFAYKQCRRDMSLQTEPKNLL
jgi:hypothetical protein